MIPGRPCTPAGAHYCHRHGKCTCVRLSERGGRVWDESAHPDCPLHGVASKHPIKTKVLRMSMAQWHRR